MVSGALAQGIEESCVIYLNERVEKIGITDESARSVKIKSYDNMYKLKNMYIIDGVDYTDDGKTNDDVANDGIFTSMQLLPVPTETSINTITPIKSDKFKFNDLLLADNPNVNKTTFSLTCKFRRVTQGYSLFGNSCSDTCIQIYDCEFTINF